MTEDEMLKDIDIKRSADPDFNEFFGDLTQQMLNLKNIGYVYGSKDTNQASVIWKNTFYSEIE